MDKHWLFACSAAASLALAASAQAQTPATSPNAQVQEIVVTARKRDERLIDVPVAVSAFAGESLARQNVTDLTKIAATVPNLMISKAASGAGATLAIRGVGSTFTDAGIEQTVSINIDGMQLNRGFITNVAFFDLKQVEVLKGPQALFFGKNSPAGVISLTSADPTSSFSASAKAGYEFRADEAYFEGVVSGPLTPTLGARLAIRADKMKGWMNNTARSMPDPFEQGYILPGADADARGPTVRTLTGRLTLRWAPTDTFTATLKVLGNAYDDDGLANIYQVIACAPGRSHQTTTNGVIRLEDPNGECVPDDRMTHGLFPAGKTVGFPGSATENYSHIHSYLGTLNLAYTHGPLSFTSVTGYNKSGMISFGSFDDNTYDRFPGVNAEYSELVTEELRINTHFNSPVNFAGGLYYETGSRSAWTYSRGPGAPPANPVNGYTFGNVRYADFDNHAKSAFGQVILQIRADLELTVGARYTDETKITALYSGYTSPFYITTYRSAALPPIVGRFSGHNVSPEATLSWHVQPSLVAYAAYKTGYKSGGTSVSATLTTTATAANLAFGPERAKGGEVGLKGDLLDRRLTFSADVYDYKFEGLQVSASTQQPNGTYLTAITNAASARTKGVEAEFAYSPIEGLQLSGSAAYNRARLLRFTNAPCYSGQTVATGCVVVAGRSIQDRSGQVLSRAPKWVLTGGLDYRRQIGVLELALGAQARYSSAYLTQDDGSPYFKQPAFATVDANLRLSHPAQGWELALIGRNLTNRYYVLTSNNLPGGLPGEIHGVVSRSRELALQASYKF